jgi:PAS domain S-box-containing protein
VGTYILGNGVELVSGKVTDDPVVVWVLGILIGLSVIGLSLSRYRDFTSPAFKFFLLYVNFNIILGYGRSTMGDAQSQLFYLLFSYVLFVVCSQALDSPRELIAFTAVEIIMFSIAAYVYIEYKPLLTQSMHIFTFAFVMAGNFMIHYQRIKLTQISGNSTIQFKAISENARDIQSVISRDFNFLYINPAVRDLSGYDYNSLTGKKFLTLVADEDQQVVSDALTNIKQTPEEKQSIEYRIKTTRGNLIWVESIFSSFKSTQTGKADLIFAETRNIETRKQLEEEIQQQLHMEEMLIKHSNQFINVGRTEIQSGIDIALGEFGNMLHADAVLIYRMHGKIQDEFRSTNQWVAKQHSGLLNHFNLSIKINQQLVAFLRSLRGEKASHGNFYDVQQLKSVQALNDLEITGHKFYLVPLQSGNIVNGFAIFVFSNYTPNLQLSFFGLIGNMISSAFTRMRTEMRLHEAQLTNESILRALPDWLYIINKKGEFIGTNNSSTLPDYIPDYGLIGRTFGDVMPGEIASSFTRSLTEVIDSDVASSFEYHDTTIYKDRFFKAIIAPFKANEYLVIIRDITDLKLAQNELLSKAKKLEQSNKELEEFAYVVSHDMKQPIRTIISYLSLLKKKHMNNLSPEAQEFVNFSIDGANKMSDLIRDILQYSRLDQQISLQKDISLNGIVKKVCKGINETIVANNAEVSVDELPAITGNETMLTELFQNLIENGIKYNTNAKKTVKVTVSDKSEHEWLFTISDNGIGFEQQYAQQIFKIFKRLHTDGEFQGTGIGLTICQKVVEKHGGKIWAESQKGVGSKFFFTLPKQVATVGQPA